MSNPEIQTSIPAPPESPNLDTERLIPPPRGTKKLQSDWPIPASPESPNFETEMPINPASSESPNLPIPASAESQNLERGRDDNEQPNQAADRDRPLTEAELNVISTGGPRLATIEETEMPNQQREPMPQITEFIRLGRKIYKAAINDKWDDEVSAFFNEPNKLKEKISYEGETALCVAVGTNASHNFVHKIVEKIMATPGEGVETLRIKNAESEENALHVAARLGNVKAAKLLVSEDPQMPQISARGFTPLAKAASGNDVETLEYLLTVTRDVDDEMGKNPFKGIEGDKLLTNCIYRSHFHVALHLVKKYPVLTYQMHETNEETKALEFLASKPAAFRSGTRLGFFQSIIYSGISVEETSLAYNHPNAETSTVTTQNIPGESTSNLQGSHENTNETAMNTVQKLSKSIKNLLQRCLLKVACFKKIYDMKVKHKQAEQLVKEIIGAVVTQPDESVVYHVLGPAIRMAVRYGIHELIEECLLNDPGLLWYRDVHDESSFFELAVKHRQEKVFNLIYQMSAYKTTSLAKIADDGNTLLHVVGKLPPYHRLTTVTGPAFQMQRELQWFQEVKKITKASKLEPAAENDNWHTPEMVFKEEHKELLKDAQNWTNGISSSSTVVAALVVTMTFAAMFNIPGGHATNGHSPFATQGTFGLFVISDATALVYATISVLMFLSTLAHSSQEDFLRYVPARLAAGLLTLFISLLATMVAFSATFAIVARDPVLYRRPSVRLFGTFCCNILCLAN